MMNINFLGFGELKQEARRLDSQIHYCMSQLTRQVKRRDRLRHRRERQYNLVTAILQASSPKRSKELLFSKIEATPFVPRHKMGCGLNLWVMRLLLGRALYPKILWKYILTVSECWKCGYKIGSKVHFVIIVNCSMSLLAGISTLQDYTDALTNFCLHVVLTRMVG